MTNGTLLLIYTFLPPIEHSIPLLVIGGQPAKGSCSVDGTGDARDESLIALQDAREKY